MDAATELRREMRQLWWYRMLDYHVKCSFCQGTAVGIVAALLGYNVYLIPLSALLNYAIKSGTYKLRPLIDADKQRLPDSGQLHHGGMKNCPGCSQGGINEPVISPATLARGNRGRPRGSIRDSRPPAQPAGERVKRP